MYEIRWDEDAKEDMRRMKLRAKEVAQIVDDVEEELTHEPERASKRKKIIRPEEGLPFEHLDPVWQLRIGEFRVFYDVSEQDEPKGEDDDRHEGVVRIRAVRRKPPHKTTKEIL
jgi:mRNA-degrading endonuclease RelE of RelBE toxin-antitoxin system